MNIQRRGFSMMVLFLSLNLLFSGFSSCWASDQKEMAATAPVTGISASATTNIQSFGAKGDGSSDDSASIQNAINSLPDGGTVFFPKGQYEFSRSIVLPSNIRLLGDGKTATVLHYQGYDRAIVSGDRKGHSGTGSYYVTIENLTLQGAHDCGTGLYFTARYLTINNATISHFGTGIDCQFSWTNKFYNVSFFYDNIAFNGGSFLNANSFVNCIFSTGQIAVTLKQGWNISFVGCQFEGYTEACFSFHDAFKRAIWNLSINNCYFENTGKCFDAGPSCSFSELSLTNNIITIHGPGLAIAVDNSNQYGKDTGNVANNTFFRDNNSGSESFVHLEGLALLLFRGNKGFATPGYAEIQLLDEATRGEHHSSYEVDLADANRLNFSGVGAFEKGVILGGKLPPSVSEGLIIYDNGKLKIFLNATQSEYLLTGKSGPTSQRPNEGFTGMIYFDTTLGRPLWWTGSKWVDANGESK